MDSDTPKLRKTTSWADSTFLLVLEAGLATMDGPSGNDFGHRESRESGQTEGLYYVVLPDGRKQTVEYKADQDGYKPRISYEDEEQSYYSDPQSYDGSQDGPY
ncbi:Uncharacterized protein OBRU01_03301 [Operophtera brumata]|uniref:Cuticle protein n=1 Tax=Operophtera brumata TaxID=104452 RepID=A0A0L7LPG0_OPEBR|nr:Uncharacterized protein OBRU01_03301 [Operophtera brumata]